MGVTRRLLLVAASALVTMACGGVAGPPGDGARDVRLITIVNVSDWHGQLEPLTVRSDGRPRRLGGAAVLKYYFDQERRRNRGGTLVVTAGDAVGATPPVSSFFEDVPAVGRRTRWGSTSTRWATTTSTTASSGSGS